MQDNSRSGHSYHSNILEKAFAQSDQLVNDVLSSFKHGKGQNQPGNSNGTRSSGAPSSSHTRYTGGSDTLRSERGRSSWSRASPQRDRGVHAEDYEDDLETAAALQEPFVEGFSPQRYDSKEWLWNTWGSSSLPSTSTAPAAVANRSTSKGDYQGDYGSAINYNSKASGDGNDYNVTTSGYGTSETQSVAQYYMKSDHGVYSDQRTRKDPQIESYAKHAKELLQSWLTVENDAAGVKKHQSRPMSRPSSTTTRTELSGNVKQDSGKRVAGGGGKFRVTVSRNRDGERQDGRTSSADTGQLVIDTVGSSTGNDKLQRPRTSSRARPNSSNEQSKSKGRSNTPIRRSRERKTFRNSAKLSKVYGYNTLTPSDRKMMQKLIDKYDESDSDEGEQHQVVNRAPRTEYGNGHYEQSFAAAPVTVVSSTNTDVGQWVTDETNSSCSMDHPVGSNGPEVLERATEGGKRETTERASETPSNQRNYQEEIQKLRAEAAEARERIDAWKSGSAKPSLFQTCSSNSAADSRSTSKDTTERSATAEHGESLLQKLQRLRGQDDEQDGANNTRETSLKSAKRNSSIGQHAAHEKAVRTAELRQKHFNRILRRIFRAWKTQAGETHRRKRMEEALNRIDRARKRHLRNTFDVWKRQFLRTQRINAVAEGKYRFHVYNKVWTAWRKYIALLRRKREEELQEKRKREHQELANRADRHYKCLLYSKCMRQWRSGAVRSKEERKEEARQGARKQQMERFMSALNRKRSDPGQTEQMTEFVGVAPNEALGTEVQTMEQRLYTHPENDVMNSEYTIENSEGDNTLTSITCSAPEDRPSVAAPSDFSSTVPSHSPITTPVKSLVDTSNDVCSWEAKDASDEYIEENSISPVSSFTRLEGSSTQLNVSCSRIGQDEHGVAVVSSTVHASSVNSARPPPSSVHRGVPKNVPALHLSSQPPISHGPQSAKAVTAQTPSQPPSDNKTSNSNTVSETLEVRSTNNNVAYSAKHGMVANTGSDTATATATGEGTPIANSVAPSRPTKVQGSTRANPETAASSQLSRHVQGSGRVIRGDGKVICTAQPAENGQKQNNWKKRSRFLKKNAHTYPNQTKVHKEVQEKVSRADIFRRLTLLKKYGLPRLREMVRSRHLREQKAESHFRVQLLEKFFRRLHQCTRNEKYRRRVKHIETRKRRLRRLVSKSFKRWRSIYDERSLKHKMEELSTSVIGTITVNSEGATVTRNDTPANCTVAPSCNDGSSIGIGGLQKTTTEVATVTDTVREFNRWADEFRKGKLRRRCLRAWKSYFRQKKRACESKKRQEQLMEQVQAWLSGSTLD
eukprot:gb/GECG01012455.1/.p1 GENE.gb/GECG01012455.1/~~gb/GECG01012455.1/.p1  ORF type:complete len:1314 (+),score=187.38 gb/GECG01012455.1/:1-3942(+)